MACLKDDKSVMFLILAGRAFHSRGPATEKARSPNFSWCKGCRIQSSLLNEADDVLAMTRSMLLYLLDTKDCSIVNEVCKQTKFEANPIGNRKPV